MKLMISNQSGLIKKMFKAGSSKSKANRQTKIMIIILSLVLIQFSACLPAPTSPLTKIKSEPLDFPLIHLDRDICPSKRLYNYLIRASKGKIGPQEQADYVITRLDFNSEIELSLQKAYYRLYCEVSDKNNKKVVDSFASRLVKGDFEPGADYRDTADSRYKDYIARDAANQLLNDLYKKMPAVLAAKRR
jgi:hypothetical protein